MDVSGFDGEKAPSKNFHGVFFRKKVIFFFLFKGTWFLGGKVGVLSSFSWSLLLAPRRGGGVRGCLSVLSRRRQKGIFLLSAVSLSLKSLSQISLSLEFLSLSNFSLSNFSLSLSISLSLSLSLSPLNLANQTLLGLIHQSINLVGAAAAAAAAAAAWLPGCCAAVFTTQKKKRSGGKNPRVLMIFWGGTGRTELADLRDYFCS